MKKLLFTLLLSTVVMTTSSCSLVRSWGSLSANRLEVVENYRYESAGTVYRLKTYLVSESPRETITEIVEVTEGWADR